MKFKDYALFMPDSEYRQIDAFSYSLLKAIDENGPIAMIEREDKKSKAMEFGSLVDILLTNPENKDSIFHTKAIEKPTAMLLTLADSLLMDILLNDKTYDEIINTETIHNKIAELKLWSNIKDPVKLQEKWQNTLFYNYIKESIEAKGKIIVTPEILESAENASKVLITHDYTKDYFIETEDIEILKQPVFLYNFKGVQGKAKIDILKINHKSKSIQIIDIKTGSELPSKFENSFYFFKYYLQVISYVLAIFYIKENIPEFKDYKIENFLFLYLSKKLPETPVKWEVEEKLYDKFVDGWDNNRGFIDLVNDYVYYKTNDIYSCERKVVEKEGLFKIQLS